MILHTGVNRPLRRESHSPTSTFCCVLGHFSPLSQMKLSVLLTFFISTCFMFPAPVFDSGLPIPLVIIVPLCSFCIYPAPPDGSLCFFFSDSVSDLTTAPSSLLALISLRSECLPLTVCVHHEQEAKLWINTPVFAPLIANPTPLQSSWAAV